MVSMSAVREFLAATAPEQPAAAPKPCPNPLCVAGVVTVHYAPFAHSEELHAISFDCVVCDGTALDIRARAS